MVHRSDRNGMKQGSATAEVVGVERHRNDERRLTRKADKRGVHRLPWPGRIARAAPFIPGRKPRLDITNVGRLFRP